MPSADAHQIRDAPPRAPRYHQPTQPSQRPRQPMEVERQTTQPVALDIDAEDRKNRSAAYASRRPADLPPVERRQHDTYVPRSSNADWPADTRPARQPAAVVPYGRQEIYEEPPTMQQPGRDYLNGQERHPREHRGDFY